MENNKIRVVVCVSGGGTNLQAIIDRIQDNTISHAEIVRVISNNEDAYALERARAAGIEAVCISPKQFASRDLFNKALLEGLNEAKPDLVVLAGFLVAISPEIVAAYPGKIINIHPSLIPSFCGKGYYGLHVHEAVLARGAKVTGATVHFVDDGMDSGPIILQKAVAVKATDTPEVLQRRVMEEAEWQLLPQAIEYFATGKIVLKDRIAVIKEDGER